MPNKFYLFKNIINFFLFYSIGHFSIVKNTVKLNNYFFKIKKKNVGQKLKTQSPKKSSRQISITQKRRKRTPQSDTE